MLLSVHSTLKRLGDVFTKAKDTEENVIKKYNFERLWQVNSKDFVSLAE